MKLKSFFHACLLAAAVFIASPQAKAVSVSDSIQKISQDSYTYVRVNVDGVIWIYVYDSKGNLIDAYPEA